MWSSGPSHRSFSYNGDKFLLEFFEDSFCASLAHKSGRFYCAWRDANGLAEAHDGDAARIYTHLLSEKVEKPLPEIVAERLDELVNSSSSS